MARWCISLLSSCMVCFLNDKVVSFSSSATPQVFCEQTELSAAHLRLDHLSLSKDIQKDENDYRFRLLVWSHVVQTVEWCKKWHKSFSVARSSLGCVGVRQSDKHRQPIAGVTSVICVTLQMDQKSCKAVLDWQRKYSIYQDTFNTLLGCKLWLIPKYHISPT